MSASPELHELHVEEEKRRLGILKEGFLLRKLAEGEQWGRRYFVLTHDGQLRWYSGPEDMHGEGGSGAEATQREESYGQVTLRFFAVELLDAISTLAAAREGYEDAELQHMLPSCKVFELRSGAQSLRLAWHHAVADEWLHSLSVQCVLAYQKSPVFSDKQVRAPTRCLVLKPCLKGANSLPPRVDPSSGRMDQQTIPPCPPHYPP